MRVNRSSTKKLKPQVSLSPLRLRSRATAPPAYSKKTNAAAVAFPLLPELKLLLLRLLGLAGVLLVNYGSYLLTPHLRELIYGFFGRPVSRLDQAWHWLREQLPKATLPEEAETHRNSPTYGLSDKEGGRALLQELKKQGEETRRSEENLSREIRSGQQDLRDELGRLRRDQEHSDRKISELRTASAPS